VPRRIGTATFVAALVLTAGCDAIGLTTPRIECSRTTFDPPSRLGCEAAITVALRRLGPGHPPIERIRFEYGHPCREAIGCPYVGAGAIGWVGIEFRPAGAPDYIVGVQVHDDGRVTQRTRPFPDQASS
jgi:hypothetical protein